MRQEVSIIGGREAVQTASTERPLTFVVALLFVVEEEELGVTSHHSIEPFSLPTIMEGMDAELGSAFRLSISLSSAPHQQQLNIPLTQDFDVIDANISFLPPVDDDVARELTILISHINTL